MNIEEAMQWVEKNCSDASTLERLRSRRVARTLSEEVAKLREVLGYFEELATTAGRQRDNALLAKQVGVINIMHELDARCFAAERDAERYRWLKDGRRSMNLCVWETGSMLRHDRMLSGKALDKAIDKTMKVGAGKTATANVELRGGPAVSSPERPA
jgi:hypothetical protein